jgi:lipopolysaccharide/colanic/teichoic acid biosynthesis glycosyltransferase
VTRIGRSVYRPVKRLIDVLGSIVLLVVTAPIIAAVAAAVRWRLGSPVLFRQQRPGLGGAPFVLIKFRTMRILGPSDSWANDAQRITPLGLWLRSTSLDELPTLWNVLRGDMSLVGPRPLLMEYLGRYSPEQFRRHDVRPGITGLAQVRGRNELSWDEKFTADLEYVDGVSPGLDARILGATLIRVLRRDGVSTPGEAHLTPFLGNDRPPSYEGGAGHGDPPGLRPESVERAAAHRGSIVI